MLCTLHSTCYLLTAFESQRYRRPWGVGIKTFETFRKVQGAAVLRRIVAGRGFAGRSWGSTKHLHQNKLPQSLDMPGLTNLMGKKRHGSKRAHLMPQHAAKANSRSSNVLRYMARMIVRFDWTWPGLVHLSSTFRLSTLLFDHFTRHWVHAYFASFWAWILDWTRLLASYWTLPQHLILRTSSWLIALEHE